MTLASPFAPHTLPASLTPFVGREEELREVARLLAEPECRLLTVTGPGGIGKTRLATEAARRAVAEQDGPFPDGIYFVDLAPVSSGLFIVSAIATTLGLAVQGSADLKVQLLEFLRKRKLLLVMDNCEHLLDGVELFAEVLESTPALKLLATSRERLNLRGETLFPLEGLPVPADESTERAEAYSAIELFVQHARRTAGSFSLGPAEKRAVVRICQVVQGMPLGIELAASWVRTLHSAEIVQEIEQDLDFLSVPMRDAPERHRSIRAVFEHSWRLLGEEERRVFRRLVVFRGGFQREAAERVAGASLRVLTSLIDKSLVRRKASERYELHELIRQFTEEKLRAAGALEETRDTHLLYGLDLAEAAEPHLRGAQQVAWLERLEREHDNLRVALRWAEESGASETGLRLAGALYWFWWSRGHLREGREWLTSALSRADPACRTAARAKALNGAGVLAWSQGDYSSARSLLEESLTVRRELRDIAGITTVLNNLAMVMHGQGDFASARSLLEESLALERRLGNPWGAAAVLNNLGNVARNQGDYDAAHLLYEESLALRRELGDRRSIADSLNNLGNVACDQGDYASARVLHEESLALRRELENRPGAAMSLTNLGFVACEQGDYHLARALYGESLAIKQELGDKRGIVWSLEGVAALEGAQGKSERAALLWGAAEALRQTIGAPRSPDEGAQHERVLAVARTHLDQATFAAAWEKGRTMPLEQVICYAVNE